MLADGQVMIMEAWVLLQCRRTARPAPVSGGNLDLRLREVDQPIVHIKGFPFAGRYTVENYKKEYSDGIQ